jgi:hypothetical protein
LNTANATSALYFLLLLLSGDRPGSRKNADKDLIMLTYQDVSIFQDDEIAKLQFRGQLKGSNFSSKIIVINKEIAQHLIKLKNKHSDIECLFVQDGNANRTKRALDSYISQYPTFEFSMVRKIAINVYFIQKFGYFLKTSHQSRISASGQ